MPTPQETSERFPAPPPERGTFTFVFTDIEGSTRLWERYPDETSAIIARHDDLLAQEFESRGGHVFKMVGDAVCCAFAQAGAALRGAMAAQQAVAAEPWPLPQGIRIRVALHTGPAEMRRGDYFGSALNLTARLLSAGHGEQILLSATASALVQENLPDDAALLELGTHFLRDIPRPQAIFGCTYPGCPNSFPPLRTLDDSPTNLPAPINSFVGRERDLAAIADALLHARLVTLAGPGGGGKTRLALQAGRALQPRFADGVWFVDLATLTEAAQVVQAAAAALGVREDVGQSLLASLTEYLRFRRLLLVLDNCEQVTAGCAEFAGEVLRGCAEVRLLATSREPLGLRGETLQRVSTLPLPPESASVEIVRESEAVQLFAARAEAALPGFAVTAQNADSVAAICRTLDGIPLALELAAARVKMMSVAQIAARVGDRLRLLTGGGANLPRHQTLRAAIEWSDGLLADPERLLFRRVSVFAGGWTLDAAEAVCADAALPATDILDLLGALVDKSMAIFEDGADGARYRLLETIRQFGLERLGESGEQALLRQRHAAWFRHLAETSVPELQDARQADCLDRLEADYANLRTALEWSLPEDAAHTGLALVGALYRYWAVRGSLTEGREWARQMLAQAPDDVSGERALALNAAGGLALSQGDFDAARAWFETSLTLCRHREDHPRTADLLNNLGMLHMETGENAQARVILEESLALQRVLNDAAGIASTLTNLACVAQSQGDFAEARVLLTECLALDRAHGDLSGIANSALELGGLARQAGDFAAARALLTESLTLRRRLGDRPGIAECLESFASLLADAGHSAVAARCWAAAETLRDALGVRLSDAALGDRDLEITAAKAAREEAFDIAWQDGATRPLAEIVDEALATPP